MTHGGVFRWVNAMIAEFDGTATAEDFRALAKEPRLQTLQCSSPVSDAVWSLVQEHFLTARPDVSVRIYEYAPSGWDLGFVRLLPSLRRLSAHHLSRASGIEALTSLPHLEYLELGIFELQDFGVLDGITPGLETLRLDATRSRKPSLAPLRRFQSLRTLHLEGHSKGIAVLSELLELDELTLRSVTTPDLTYLAPLQKLSSLELHLGGIRNFQGIEGKRSLKRLGLWQVRGLCEIDVVGRLPGLQSLFLQSLPRVESLPNMSGLLNLRRVCLESMKGLHDFSGLAAAPALEEILLIGGKNLSPQQLLPVLAHPRLRRISAGFGSDRRNREFEILRTAHGKDALWDVPNPVGSRQNSRGRGG